MALLNEKVASETGQILAAMREPVVMTLFARAECHVCGHVRELATELLALSPALRFAERDLAADAAEAARLGVERAPTLLLAREGDARSPVRYAGLPAGHEFGAFLRTLLALSTGVGMPGVDAAAAAPITRGARLQTYVLASCPRCPQMAYLTASIAVASPQVTTEIVDAEAFPELVAEHRVGRVPSVIINGSVTVDDVVPVAELIATIAGA